MIKRNTLEGCFLALIQPIEVSLRATVDTTVALTWLGHESQAAADDIRRDARLFLFTTEEMLTLARPETIVPWSTRRKRITAFRIWLMMWSTSGSTRESTSARRMK